MSMTMTSCLPAGAAIDQGLVPTVFCRPPQGAIAGLALVVRMATQPADAGHAGAEVLDQHVGVARHPAQEVLSLGLAEVQRHGALVAGDDLPP
jgi:hypothetical protein